MKIQKVFDIHYDFYGKEKEEFFKENGLGHVSGWLQEAENIWGDDQHNGSYVNFTLEELEHMSQENNDEDYQYIAISALNMMKALKVLCPSIGHHEECIMLIWW